MVEFRSLNGDALGRGLSLDLSEPNLGVCRLVWRKFEMDC